MFPKEVGERYSFAQSQFRKGRAAEALEILEGLERSAPNHPEFLYARALCLQGLARDREGMLLCNKLYTMHNDRRGLQLRSRWFDPPHGVAADTGVAPQAPEIPGVHTLPAAAPGEVTAACLQDCALVVVDVPGGERPAPCTRETMPPLWRDSGYVPDDVNAATDYAWDIAIPNAAKAVKLSRALDIYTIFVKWGFRFPDGADLDPETYQAMRKNYGDDPANWPGHIDDPNTLPSELFEIHTADYIVPKTSENAFASSNFNYLLTNLGIRNLIFAGGHTETCLGKTATSAKSLGYHAICLEDAVFNTRQSMRKKAIEEAHFDSVITLAEFRALAQRSIEDRRSAAS